MKPFDAVKRDLVIKDVISVRSEVMLRPKRLAEDDVDQVDDRFARPKVLREFEEALPGTLVEGLDIRVSEGIN